MTRSSNYSTIIMVICPIYSTSKLTSTYSALSPSIGTLLIVGKVDFAPTVEEYTALLCCPKIQIEKAYSRAGNIPIFLKKLMNIMGMSK
ncbi:hypothetical protein Goari_000005 [Gossypium aridum]|uniref:Uncharacterized protein n=1 Tax=Gossypium aridum TaxID=34290 RepID=A0A7J8YRV2_GOSAI|nr:hypothetical protein [Gossypium aridum]